MRVVLLVSLMVALVGCGSRRETFEYEGYEIVRPRERSPAPLVVPLPKERIVK